MNVSGKHKNWKLRWVAEYKNQLSLFFFLWLSFFCALIDAQKIDGGEGSQYSVLVESIISGEIMKSKNPDLLMTPASTLKVTSSAMALETLGAEYVFTTGIYIKGAIEKGTLKGDLIIKGGGDGTLGSSNFVSTAAVKILEQIQQKLHEAGIKRIEGAILVDQSLFPANYYPDGRLWEDMVNYYGAPPAALSWRDNSFELFLTSSQVIGSICKITGTIPAFPDINFRSSVKAATGRKDSAYIFGYPGLSDWEVRGSIPAGRASFKIKGAMPFPGIRFGEEIAGLFYNDEMVEVKVSNQIFDYDKLTKLVEIVSPSVSEIIKVVNHKSNNLLADHLFLATGGENNKSYDWDGSRDYYLKFWSARLSLPSLRVLDGSGLSPKNLVSARFIVDVLRFMSQSPNFEVFKSSLAVGGQSGTLANMWKAPTFKGNVVGKSGFMEGTLGYCGYIYTQKGDVLVFSVMVNQMTNDLPSVRASIENFISDLIINY